LPTINSDKTKKQALFFLPLETLLAIFLTISEGDITEAHSHRKFISNDSNGQPKFGEMKLTNAVYSQWRVTWLIEHSTLHQLLWLMKV